MMRIQIYFYFTTFLLVCLQIRAGDSSPGGIDLVTMETWEDEIREWQMYIEDKPVIDINTAWITLWHVQALNDSNTNTTLILYDQNDQCYGCEMQLNTYIGENGTSILIQTDFGNNLQIRHDPSGLIICSDYVARLRERGDYWLIISADSDTGNYTCDLVLTNNPANYNLPILWAFLVFCGLALIYVLAVKLYRSDRCKHKNMSSLNLSDSKTVLVMSISTITLDGDNKAADTTLDITPADNGSRIDSTPASANGSILADGSTPTNSNDSIRANGDTPANSNGSILANGSTPANGNGSILANGSTPATASGDEGSTPADDFAVTLVKEKVRRRSLDAFRGLSLLIVVFINYGGGGYYFFDHVQWDGLFVADLVFPWFVWIMGVSIAFSFDGQLDKGVPKWRIFLKILERDLKKFLIGLCLNAPNNQEMKSIRIFGILQRLAVTHFFTASIHLAFVSKGGYTPKVRRCVRLRDVTEYWLEWLVMAAILALHICITYLLPLPGCPTGYVGPGGLHEGGMYTNCTGGAAQYIDSLILGESHMSPTSSTEGLYESTMRYDSEGILGSLGVIFTCFLGVQAGKIIAIYGGHTSRVVRWIVWAIITGTIGMALCQCSQFEGLVPINKNLWSVSFTMAMSSTGFVMLTVMYILIDATQIWDGAPFIYPGINSVGIYILHLVFANYFPVTWQWPDYSEHWQRLFRGLWGCTFWTLVAYFMFIHKLFFIL